MQQDKIYFLIDLQDREKYVDIDDKSFESLLSSKIKCAYKQLKELCRIF